MGLDKNDLGQNENIPAHSKIALNYKQVDIYFNFLFCSWNVWFYTFRLVCLFLDRFASLEKKILYVKSCCLCCYLSASPPPSPWKSFCIATYCIKPRWYRKSEVPTVLPHRNYLLYISISCQVEHASPSIATLPTKLVDRAQCCLPRNVGCDVQTVKCRR